MNMNLHQFCSKGGKALKGAAKAHRAKLSPEQVSTIRKSDETADVLAEKYNVHLNTIYRIKKGERYEWVK